MDVFMVSSVGRVSKYQLEPKDKKIPPLVLSALCFTQEWFRNRLITYRCQVDPENKTVPEKFDVFYYPTIGEVFVFDSKHRDIVLNSTLDLLTTHMKDTTKFQNTVVWLEALSLKVYEIGRGFVIEKLQQLANGDPLASTTVGQLNVLRT